MTSLLQVVPFILRPATEKQNAPPGAFLQNLSWFFLPASFVLPLASFLFCLLSCVFPLSSFVLILDT